MNTNTPQTTVLLVEDEASDAKLIQDALEGVIDGAFHVEWVTRLADAIDYLNKKAVEIVLLDLTLSDGQGIEVFDRILLAAPMALILVLNGEADEEVAREAMLRGAHDYFAKAHIDAHWLPRALRYVIERKVSRDALRNSEARFRAISDAAPLGIFVSDLEGACVYTNAAYQKISGLDFERTLGTNWSMAIHPEDRERVLAEWRIAARNQEPFQTEYRFQQEDHSVVWTRVYSASMREGNTSLGLVQTVEDISERKQTEFALHAAQESLFEEKERAQVTLNSIGDAVLTSDLLGNVSYLNQVAEAMTGWSREGALGRPLAEVFKLIDGTTREISPNPAQQAVNDDEIVGLASNSVLIRRDGSEVAIEDSTAPIHNRDGQVTGAVLVFHDVSESRAMALRMAHQAHHDFLTGLPNRMLLTERLAQAIGHANRHKKQVALLFLDLDHFKHVNDSLGHAIGDQLLRLVADNLVASVRTTDTVCRQGGDEFVILLAEIEEPQDAAQVAEKLLAAFAAPHLIDGHELHVGLSIGISLYPEDGDNVESVMQNADTAMFHAKANGRNCYQFFRAEMNTNAIHRMEVENSLRRALRQNEFVLHYQPQIDLASGEMTGAEALIRWQEPELGLLQPAEFVPIAKECGLIVPIGRWVLREACRQVQAWITEGRRVVRVAVNISAIEFKHKDFLPSLAEILRESGVAPNYLELELGEGSLMQDVAASATLLAALKSMGVRLAIDNFGTGYSSLSYLKRFPIDTLKIDQSFVRDIAVDTDGASIVSAVIGMGKNLNQQVIAEGVETRLQLDFLRQQQCDEVQGFLLGPPLSADNFELLLAAGPAAV